MTQHLTPDFIVIDDDPMNNLICAKILEFTFPKSKTNTFIHPRDGLNYILLNYLEEKNTPLILFLDINMPDLSGWDVLDHLKEFSDKVMARMKIYMLSSSICPEDKEKTATYSFVSGYINKPLSKAKLDAIFPIS